MSNSWTHEDEALVRRYFVELGADGMRAKGMLVNRTLKAIANRASDLGVTRLVEDAWAIPAHEYSGVDQAFRSWGGPVDRAPLRWAA